MDGQAFNPYLPSYEYIPDAEPHIFGDRLYIYGSHDKFNGISFCLNDYVCWSAPLDDLSAWRYEGVIYRRKQDPNYKPDFMNAMYAPDVCRGPDGRYYLYYFLGQTGYICVAVCDSPAGKYEFLGHVKYPDGVLLGDKGEPFQFDPGLFIDDDGKIYMYTGFGPVKYPSILVGGHRPTEHGAMGFELDKDMLTIKSGPQYIGIKGKTEGKGTPYEGHEFFEASSMRKFDGKYYFIYSSFEGHELCYAVSDNPLSGFEFGGTLVSNGDVGVDGITRENCANYMGNTHGSLIKIGENYYVFYHRQTNRHQFSRQACAEKIEFKGGKFLQARLTSCGLNGKPLAGKGTYEARIACHLHSAKGAYWYGVIKRRKRCYPYFTQSGRDREDNPDQHIANFCNGSVAVFRYFDLRDTKSVGVTVRGNARGIISVSATEGGEPLTEIEVNAKRKEKYFSSTLKEKCGVTQLVFTFRGKGKCDFLSFTLN